MRAFGIIFIASAFTSLAAASVTKTSDAQSSEMDPVAEAEMLFSVAEAAAADAPANDYLLPGSVVEDLQRESDAVRPTSQPLLPSALQEELFRAENPFEDGTLVAANEARKKKVAKNATKKAAPSARSASRPATRSRPSATAASVREDGRKPRKLRDDARLQKALQLAKNGQFQEASKLLFQMSRSPLYAAESAQIKYILGLMLYEMKFNQAAAFVFYDVVRQESKRNPNSRYLKQSLEKLGLAADALDSDVLLRYAIKKVDENEFPAANRDMLYFRIGEVRLNEKDFTEAARQFGRIKRGSIFYSKAKYKQALAYAEAGDLERSLSAFDDLATTSTEGGVTDRNRVNSMIGRARVLYQKKNWDGAIDAYREIPRDTEQWHDSLFETSWAMLQSARFRSALSNFHTLHSPYYENYYQPESLLLRGIVYLYICRYEEMDKVLDLFEKVYRPLRKDVRALLDNNRDALTYYKEIVKLRDSYEPARRDRSSRGSFQIPFLVGREILREGDVRRTFSYLAKLDDERRRLGAMPSAWTTSGVGKYSRKIVEKRIEATRLAAGKQVRRHLANIQTDLRDLFEQKEFLRFEMLSGKKEVVKKEIAGKGLQKQKIDEDAARDYFIQNGYEYWPFKGEYWLDEIGNYHYVGVQACD